MVKIDLITGFLGSGKTTFLLGYAKHLLKIGLRIGILEYDYGAVNVDMLLLGGLRGEKCELEMLAAACDEDCMKRRFTTKLISMAMSGYDRVIIEPSGVFDMDLFYDALRDDPLENMYEIGNVFAIVNGKSSYPATPEAEFLLASQAAGAGVVLLSRSQLCTPEELASTREILALAASNIGCRSFSPVYNEKDWSTFTDGDYDELMCSGYKISDYHKTIAGSEIAYESVCSLKVPDGLGAITEKIRLLFANEEYGKIERIKGFVGDNQIHYQINATRDEIKTVPMHMGQGTIIVIGTGLNRDKITKLLEQKAF